MVDNVLCFMQKCLIYVEKMSYVSGFYKLGLIGLLFLIICLEWVIDVGRLVWVYLYCDGINYLELCFQSPSHELCCWLNESMYSYIIGPSSNPSELV
jgi:hypothetical protein